MQSGYILFLSLYFAGLLIRFFYERAKKKGRIDPKNKRVFLSVFCGMCLLWAGWFNMCPLDPLKLSLPFIVKWSGLGLFIQGLGFALGTVIQIRGVENINHLVTNGLFTKFRHPMYNGFVLWLFGWVLYHGAVISFFMGLVAIVNIVSWRKSEESELMASYGDTYLTYKKQTWF